MVTLNVLPPSSVSLDNTLPVAGVPSGTVLVSATATGASFTLGSNVITVPDTSIIPLGAYVSAGGAFPRSNNIEVIEIIFDTQVRVSANALQSSGVPPAGSAVPGITTLAGTQTSNVTTPTATAVAPVH